ncbi:MAG TPA: hypothetical protein VN937_06125 [Blastocatellia bacterium]|jgi:hypothetical protein|nr:hypothetical protein [Blastocatellia bacterium]
MKVLNHERGTHDIDREVEELRRSINARRNHGILYYVLLVVILLAGFFIGYATHSLVGAAIILIGLALVAWREVTGFKARTAVLNQLLGEKLAQRRQDDETEGV